MFLNCLAVGVGGFIGSVLRYLCGSLTPNVAFPWVTLAINVVGSFLLALLAGFVLRGAISNDQISLMLRVGLCGGFTTFSTFSLETADLISRGAVAGAIVYAVGTVVLCVLAAIAGSWLARG